MNRYEIREQQTSDTAKSLGADVLYVVWDLESGKKVPFGNYWRRPAAEARVRRLEAER